MFTELPLSGQQRRPTRTRWTFLISFAAEASVLAIVLLFPLIRMEALPKLWVPNAVIYITGQAPPPVPLKPATIPGTIRKPAVAIPFAMPRAIPHGLAPAAAPPPALGSTGPVAPGAIPAVPSTGLTSVTPQPLPPPEPARPIRVRVGGNVRLPLLIHMVRVAYPAIAKQAGVQGNVLLRAVIATDGTIKDLEYVSGPALLTGAAMDAVRQWRYEPTLLNGLPVEVETTIRINFSLTGPDGQ